MKHKDYKNMSVEEAKEALHEFLCSYCGDQDVHIPNELYEAIYGKMHISEPTPLPDSEVFEAF